MHTDLRDTLAGLLGGGLRGAASKAFEQKVKDLLFSPDSIDTENYMEPIGLRWNSGKWMKTGDFLAEIDKNLIEVKADQRFFGTYIWRSMRFRRNFLRLRT